ncbi:helix-turn-helix domain-containing protein [Georgenia deserti]|uniref:Helix-turn-helix domain-containing protein n=1 Tax=Georgenia deserti TaxID=2093781 RepID=A0ABW4L2U9_9MICO
MQHCLPKWQTGLVDDLEQALTAVGPRLRSLRQEQGMTLAALSGQTGISVSTLSRLESGARRPTLELLLPIARAHRVALDDLVDAPPTGDPRVRMRAVRAHGVTHVALSRRSDGIQAYKLIIPPREEPAQPQVHEGYEWLYVLDGRLRLLLADRDLVLSPGEAAEFDTRVPHWFGPADAQPVEVLSLFGSQGERAHLRARPKRREELPPKADT